MNVLWQRGGACSSAFISEIFGSRPEPDSVTASAGTAVLGESEFCLLYVSESFLICALSAGLLRAKFEGPEVVPEYPTAEGRG